MKLYPKYLQNFFLFAESKIIYFIFGYFLIQFFLIIIYPINYHSDALYYYSLAQDCLRTGDFYPASFHLYEDYIVAPFYINVLVIILKIFNSPITITVFNSVLTALQLFFIYNITLKLFNESSAKISIIIYIFYLNTLGLVLQNYTELLFVTLLLASFYFFLKKNFIPLVTAGILTGASIAVRPAGWAILASYIFVIFYQSWINKSIQYKYFSFAAGTILFIIFFGTFNYLHFGKIIFTSTTGPVNLLLGANDDATGGFNSTVFEEGKAGYLENSDTMTYLAKGDFYYNTAIDWIAENPEKWIVLAPAKIAHTFLWDDISISALIAKPEWNFIKTIKSIFQNRSSKSLPGNNNKIVLILYLALQLIHHIFYFYLLIIIAAGIYSAFKKNYIKDELKIIFLFTLFGLIMIIITVGSPRYKYPFIIMLIPIAAYYLNNCKKILLQSDK